jgi:tetratricopeptide (TPR) repeat protein
MNAFFQKKGPSLRWTPKTSLEQAQDLIYQAWETPKRGERLRLAWQALDLSPDCADAYVLLAEEAPETVEQAKDLYRQGVEAGERALGPEAFREHAGHFWGLVETRPYMRAKEGLADCLWEMGERQAAVEHYQELLRLNPNDNQGIRYVLLSCLLQLGRTDEAEKHLARYEDEGTAAWLFSKAMLRFLRQGNSPEARQALREAQEANRHVAPYLLGQRQIPRDYPTSVEMGSRSEAVEYVALCQVVWANTPGALDWLAAQVRSRPTPAEQAKLSGTQGQLALGLSAPAPEPTAPGGKPAEEPAPTHKEWTRLYGAAAAFKEQAPWEWIEDGDLFAVQDSDSGEMGYCSIMGGLGEVFGLAVFLGPEGFEGYESLVEGEVKHSDFEAIAMQRCLLATFEDRESLDKRDLAVIRELRLRFRGSHAWPQFRSHWPGYAPWYLTGPEARFLATVLEQAVEVSQRVRKGLDLFEGVDEDLVLARQWDQATERWEDVWRSLPERPARSQPPTALDERRLQRLRERSGSPQGSWQVDLFPIPSLVEEPGQRPYYPRAWLCTDPETEFVVGTAMLEPWRSLGECQEALLGILEKAPCLPAVIQVQPEVKNLVGPLALSLDIAVKERRRLAALEKAKKSLVSFLQR